MRAYSSKLVLERGRERIREDLQHDRDEQLHERDDHEASERDEPQQVLRRPLQLHLA